MLCKQLGPPRKDGRARWSKAVRKALYDITWVGEAAIKPVDNFQAWRIGELQREGA